MKTYYNDVNFLKGYGIMLVILYHLHPSTGNPYYWNIVRDFLEFMPATPIFFILSGYFFNEGNKFSVPYKDHLKHIAQIFIIPFISFTIITATYKMAIQTFLGSSCVRNPITLEGIINHFSNPQGGFATYLWFIYTLFLIQALYPLLKMVTHKDNYWLILFLVLNLLILPSYLCVNLVVANMPYFILGVVLSSIHFRDRISEESFLFLSLFLLSIFILLSSFADNYTWLRIVMISSFYIFLWIASFSFTKLKLLGFINLLGKRSLEIYLWHTFIIGVIRIAINKTLHPPFWMLSISLFLITCALCLLLASMFDTMPKVRHYLYGRP